MKYFNASETLKITRTIMDYRHELAIAKLKAHKQEKQIEELKKMVDRLRNHL